MRLIEDGAGRRDTEEALDQLPGHQDLLALAAEIGADLPERAQRVLETRM